MPPCENRQSVWSFAVCPQHTTAKADLQANLSKGSKRRGFIALRGTYGALKLSFQVTGGNDRDALRQSGAERQPQRMASVELTQARTNMGLGSQKHRLGALQLLLPSRPFQCLTRDHLRGFEPALITQIERFSAFLLKNLPICRNELYLAAQRPGQECEWLPGRGFQNAALHTGRTRKKRT
jgi:hypothetical protein